MLTTWTSNERHRTLKILRTGGKRVTIPSAPRTSRALDLCPGKRISGPVFLGAHGQRMDRHAADRTVKRLARRAGIMKRISPHSLRHYVNGRVMWPARVFPLVGASGELVAAT